MERLTGNDVIKALEAALAALEKERSRIDALNVFPVPDGDTGTNMLLTARAARQSVRDGSDLPEVLRSLAEGALRGARGNSGTILSQFVHGFSRGAQGASELGPREIAQGLEQAVEAAYRAVAEPQEGTMLTVGMEAARRARAAAERGGGLIEVLEEALRGAEEALEATPELLAVLKEAEVVDAGGEGLVVLARGALRALKGGEIAASGRAAGEGTAEEAWADDPHHRFAVHDAAIEYKYCTEFLVIGSGISIDELKGRLSGLGDSLVVVGGETLAKVHLHTNSPGRALEVGCAFGDLDKVSVANMVEQNRTTARAHEERRKERPSGALEAETGGREVPEADGRPRGGIAVAAVTWGAGFEAILRDHGVEALIPGGETMNPSAGQLVEAVDALAASHVILLPNDRNVILCARQAAALSKKSVRVLPTTSLPQAVSATVNFDPSKGIDECLEEMERAIRSVRVGEVTVASRRARLDGIEVAEGDVIGLVGGKVAGAGKDETEVLLEVVAALKPRPGEVITLYAGEGVDPESAEEKRRRVASAWPHCEVETYPGGQPLYTYWVAVE